MCSFDVCLYACVSVCVCTQRTGQSDQFKMVKATDFRYDMHVLKDSLDMIPNIFEKGAWPGSRDTRNFWALNSNSSKTVKATDFRFDTRCQGQSRHDPLIFFEKEASVKIHLVETCTLTSTFLLWDSLRHTGYCFRDDVLNNVLHSFYNFLH